MAEAGLLEHRRQRVRLERGAPVAGHQAGLQQKPKRGAHGGGDAGDHDDALERRRDLRAQKRRRKRGEKHARAEQGHSRAEMDETYDDQEKIQKIAPYPIVPSRKTASARCSVSPIPPGIAEQPSAAPSLSTMWRSTMGESLAVVAISDDTIDAPFDDLKPG